VGPRRGFPFALVKVLLLAALGIGACIWGLRRAYRPRAPMIVPAGSDAGGDARGGAGFGPGEVPAPDLVPVAPASGRGRE
jgi:hypothetical protein